MAERVAIEAVRQSSPFHTSILNPGTWFQRALLFRMSNTSSSRPEQAHVPPKTRRHTVNTNRLRCITMDRKSRNSMFSYFVLITSILYPSLSFSLEISASFVDSPSTVSPFLWFHNLFLTSTTLRITFGFCHKEREKNWNRTNDLKNEKTSFNRY